MKQLKAQYYTSDIQPLVSISCVTYNHGPYIEQCLEGFLMQVTNFPVEILVHDDCSTDGTTEIIKNYEKKYPWLIKPIYQPNNIYSKGIKPSTTFQYPRAKGKYIAMCEGDDYWTDPTKLQKQVDFLESYPEYVITYHDASIINEKGDLLNISKISDENKRDYTSEELISGSTIILTLSIMFRNLELFKDYPAETNFLKNGDNFLTSLLGLFGKGKYLAQIKPAMYRKHSGGVWSLLSENQKVAAKLNSAFWMFQYFKRIDHPIGKKAYFKKVGLLMNKSDHEYNLIMVKKGFLSKIVSFISKLSS